MLRRRPLLAFDFDGTLAPIVARPDDARISAAVAARLAALAARLAGGHRDRPRGRGRAWTTWDSSPRFMVGNHGAEDELDPAGAAVARRCAGCGCAEPAGARGGRLAAAGVLVEDKGQSIALHYRLSRRREQAHAR